MQQRKAIARINLLAAAILLTIKMLPWILRESNNLYQTDYQTTEMQIWVLIHPKVNTRRIRRHKRSLLVPIISKLRKHQLVFKDFHQRFQDNLLNSRKQLQQKLLRRAMDYGDSQPWMRGIEVNKHRWIRKWTNNKELTSRWRWAKNSVRISSRNQFWIALCPLKEAKSRVLSGKLMNFWEVILSIWHFRIHLEQYKSGWECTRWRQCPSTATTFRI